MKIASLRCFILALPIVFGVEAAHAVCFYPHSTISGYKLPLRVEVRNSQSIAVGTVTSVRAFQEGPSDPAGVSALVYTVDLSQELKGNVPKRITLRAENDSGGYRMARGETDLLFLTYLDGKFTVDACGNSTELPKGRKVVLEVSKLLAHPQPSP
jgi:hypothetical protein